jgi:hypothetical protein
MCSGTVQRYPGPVGYASLYQPTGIKKQMTESGEHVAELGNCFLYTHWMPQQWTNSTVQYRRITGASRAVACVADTRHLMKLIS